MAYGLPLSGIIALFCLHWLDVVKLNPFPHLRNLRSFSLGLALIFACSVAGANDLPDLGESARADLSPQLERRIGESIMKEIRQREPSYIDDPEINDYLSQLGRRLVEASANPTGDFNFFAIRDNSVNAFAMFGGFIGINIGTIMVAQSESELAGVIAHEIAHVENRHVMQAVWRALGVGMLLDLVVGGGTGAGQQAVLLAGQAASILRRYQQMPAVRYLLAGGLAGYGLMAAWRAFGQLFS